MHAAGWHVWMHSCGKVNVIIEPLIEHRPERHQPAAAARPGDRGDRAAVRRAHLLRVAVRHPAHAALAGRSAIREEAQLLLESWGNAGGRLHPLRLRRRACHRRAAGEERDHAQSLHGFRSIPQNRDELMKSIVITGSTRGIGFGLAEAFLGQGCPRHHQRAHP